MLLGESLEISADEVVSQEDISELKREFIGMYIYMLYICVVYTSIYAYIYIIYNVVTIIYLIIYYFIYHSIKIILLYIIY